MFEGVNQTHTSTGNEELIFVKYHTTCYSRSKILRHDMNLKVKTVLMNQKCIITVIRTKIIYFSQQHWK